MDLAVSSIAWTNEEEADVALTLQSMGVHYVELAPTKIWEDPTVVDLDGALKVIEWWKQYDITVIAFQSMLFTRPDLKLFQDEANRRECEEYLEKFIKLAGMMGVKKMVFGSPKNRQRDTMALSDAAPIAVDFFRSLGEAAATEDVVFCIEPNAPQYACDFITTASEGAQLVQSVGSSGFGLHLDTACMALAGDDLGQCILDNKDILEHFHISSPMLEQVEKRSDVNHEAAAAALHTIDYDKVISIEMRPGNQGTNKDRVERAVRFAQETYQV